MSYFIWILKANFLDLPLLINAFIHVFLLLSFFHILTVNHSTFILQRKKEIKVMLNNIFSIYCI